MLVVDGQELSHGLRVEADPTAPSDAVAEEVDEEELEKMWEEEEEKERRREIDD
jgi:hypothetical protein